MLVIAVDIDHDALEGLLLNVRKEEISGCGINVPGNNDWNIDLIKDIASFTGGKVCYTDWELE